MENTTQEMIYQVMAIGISSLFALIGAALHRLILNKIHIEKYGFENERVERIIGNAIDFAEQRAKELAKNGAVKLAGRNKLELARSYINKIDQSLIMRYAEQLDDMIARKIQQKIGVGRGNST